MQCKTKDLGLVINIRITSIHVISHHLFYSVVPNTLDLAHDHMKYFCDMQFSDVLTPKSPFLCLVFLLQVEHILC